MAKRTRKAHTPQRSALWSWLGWLLFAGIALQGLALGRIALMAGVDPQSTTLQRSEAWRLMEQPTTMRWQQVWVDGQAISNQLRKAVVASEDADFFQHNGVDWSAIKGAWQRNSRAEQRANKDVDKGSNKKASTVVGGSTITQQLAKNLLLSKERTFLRKGQELLLTFALEAFLSKQRILTIYLNSVEWGDGIFGAQAAASHYFKKPAAALSAREAAKLAVMLPNPKFFEDRPNSGYLRGRTNTIQARMAHIQLPKEAP